MNVEIRHRGDVRVTLGNTEGTSIRDFSPLSQVRVLLTKPSFLCVLSARSDGRPWKSEVAGSNPATQTKNLLTASAVDYIITMMERGPDGKAAVC